MQQAQQANDTPPRSWSRRRWLGGWLALASLGACSRPAPVNLDAIVPPGAQPLTERGSWDLDVMNAASSLDSALRPDFGTLDFKRWVLPADASWPTVQAQVQQLLGERWQPLSTLPEQGRGAHMRAWSERSALRGGPVFALAWVDRVASLSAGPARLLVSGSPSPGR